MLWIKDLRKKYFQYQLFYSSSLTHLRWFVVHFYCFNFLNKLIDVNFTFIEIIFINIILYSLPCLNLIFNSVQRDKNMLIVFINCPPISKKYCRDSNRFIIFYCIGTWVFSLLFRIVSFVKLFNFRVSISVNLVHF